MYDLIIIGGGPAGVAAGVYASRKKLKTLYLTESFGGQSTVSEGIENWIGTVKISGADLAKNLETHLRAYAGDIVEIKTGVWVQGIEKINVEGSGQHIFKVAYKAKKSFGNGATNAAETGTENGAGNGTETGTASNTDSGTDPFLTRSVLIATGSKRRKLEAIGADAFEHKGVTYCATCDGPLFSGQDVVVVGGGNAAFESAAQLAAYCKTVTIINRTESYRADPVTVEKILAKENVKALNNTVIEEVRGGTFVDSIMVKNTQTGAIEPLAITGVFVEIGLLPNTDFVKSVIDLDSFGKIKVDPRNQRASVDGIWSAGDCTDGLYHQNNIAAGDAVKALEDIYGYISTL